MARQNTTRVLITHQVHFLKEADWIVVMDKGCVVKQGSWSDVMNEDLSQYIKRESDEDETENNQHIEPIADDKNIPYIDEFEADKNGYSRVRTPEPKISLSRHSLAIDNEEENCLEQNTQQDEEKAIQNIRFVKVFYEYFKAGASSLVLFLLVIYLLFSQLVTSGSDFFVRYWTNQELSRLNNEKTLFDTIDGLLIYGILILAVIAVTLSRSFIFFAICMRASKKLHDESFLCLLRSPMRFFNMNQSGKILNRFSKDIGAVDELLPKAIIEAVQVNIINYHLKTCVINAFVFVLIRIYS